MSTATDIVIDVSSDEPDLPEPPPITVNLVGKTYTAHCPKDTMFLRFAAAQSAGGGEFLWEMFQFLEAALGADTMGMIRYREKDPSDHLRGKHMIRLGIDLQSRWMAEMGPVLEQLGVDLSAMQQEYSQTQGPSRDERRAAASPKSKTSSNSTGGGKRPAVMPDTAQ